MRSNLVNLTDTDHRRSFFSKLQYSTKLNKLELSCSLPQGSDNVGKVTGFATTLYVDHIVLTASRCTIPEQMFSCTSLITLELKGCNVSPNDLRFPTVRTLHLEGCSFEFHEENCSSGCLDFSQGCPKLNTLSLVECMFLDRGSLKKLVKVRALGLEKFRLLHNSNHAGFPSVDFPALKHAVVDACKPNYPQEHRREVCLSLFTFLQGLHNAEFISLPYSIIQKTLSMVPGILEYQPSPFRRLKSLTLKLTPYQKYCHTPAKVDQKHWQIPAEVATYLLSGSPAGSADLLIES
ncbi:hypothetical protein Tsubulata_016164 [Turnera subulata]|uniref:FBD domain-containing protein n=1 Tax=Turnera subulata TaxID=218843 RepID=A0A9Q0GIU8_9ROSI|nr:hypothetical protein Tsubulata_016164 [Turnera subulata]